MAMIKNCKSADELVQQHIYPLFTSDNYGILDRLVKINHAFLLVKKDGVASIKLISYNRAGTTWHYNVFDEETITASFKCPNRILERSNNAHPKAVAWRKNMVKLNKASVT